MGQIINRVLVIVPHQHCYIVEQFGRYQRTLNPGLNILIPLIQTVRYKHSLKEQIFSINASNAVTKDNVIIQIDGVLYFQVKDPIQCSYGAQHPIEFIQLLTQSVLRSEIGKLTLDQTFEERDRINANILEHLKTATEPWGLECFRHEIKDIKVPDNIRKLMNLEAESERKKRAEILMSIGTQQSAINRAEATKIGLILKAEGKANEILLHKNAIATRIRLISQALTTQSGKSAARLTLSEAYISALAGLADPNKSIIIKGNLAKPEEIIKDSLSILKEESALNESGGTI